MENFIFSQWQGNKFKFEGILRVYEFEHGHYTDLEMYSMLKKIVNLIRELILNSEGV